LSGKDDQQQQHQKQYHHQQEKHDTENEATACRQDLNAEFRVIFKQI